MLTVVEVSITEVMTDLCDTRLAIVIYENHTMQELITSHASNYGVEHALSTVSFPAYYVHMHP